ncbi:MAG: alpha/beta hydrolase [Bacteroidales bacterium]|nr:alpha/beta hydrolase [Bacteroidales bacterium]
MKIKTFVKDSRLISVLLIFAVISCCRPAYSSYTDTIEINGISLFYAAEGCGKPVILLHGNGGSHNDLETTTRQLAQSGYMVYALDSRGQGANAPLNEYHYKDMAADVYAFIKAKGLEKPAVFGFSDGGIIALQLEVMYPGTLGAIVTGGANIFVEGALVPSFEQEFLSQKNPSPLTLMMMHEPAMTPEDMAGISAPALIMAGENDLIRREHTFLIGESIPDAEVKIIQGEDHGSYICNSPLLGGLILDFFQSIGY